MSLDISGQNLSKIEIEGNSLKCYRGGELFQIHSLENITTLNCSRNQLTSIPDTLPGVLTSLYCSRNQLISLPDTLPGGANNFGLFRKSIN